jgi:hypothetical protein
MAITEKILRHLPEFYQAQIRGKLLFKVMDVFGMQLQDIENSLAEIIKSHFIDFADRNRPVPADLARIGALFNVFPWPKQDNILKLQEDTDSYRRRLMNTIRFFLGGLGTSEAVVRMTALTLGLEIPRKTYPYGDEVIIRPETRGNKDPFTTKANLYLYDSAPRFNEVNFCGEEGDEPGAKFEKSLWMNIIDNPLKPQRATKGIRHGQNWEIINDSVVDSYLEIRISAWLCSLKFPVLTNRSTGQMIRFNGIVSIGRELRISVKDRHQITAYLDDKDVSQSVQVVKGALFDRDRFNTAFFVGEKELPMLPKKRSKWHFSLSPAAPGGADETIAWTVIGASFVDDNPDPGLVKDKDKFAADIKDMTHAKFATLELLEVGEFDENKCFTEPDDPKSTASPVVFAGDHPLGKVVFDWAAREPASFSVQMNGDELLNLLDLEIIGACFPGDKASPDSPDNQFDTGIFVEVDPRALLADRLKKNVNNIKAAGINASVDFQ